MSRAMGLAPAGTARDSRMGGVREPVDSSADSCCAADEVEGVASGAASTAGASHAGRSACVGSSGRRSSRPPSSAAPARNRASSRFMPASPRIRHSSITPPLRPPRPRAARSRAASAALLPRATPRPPGGAGSGARARACEIVTGGRWCQGVRPGARAGGGRGPGPARRGRPVARAGGWGRGGAGRARGGGDWRGGARRCGAATAVRRGRAAVLPAKFLEYVKKNESGLILPHFFVEPRTNQPVGGVAHNEPGKLSGLRPVLFS